MNHKQSFSSSKPVGEESEPKVPTDLQKALTAAPLVEAAWKGLTPIARRDFIFWIDSAKQSETRSRRIEVTCSKLKAGKRRPCCFTIVPMNLYKALAATPAARLKWRDLTPTAKRDFVSWIESAKEPKARRSLVEKAVLMLAAGKQLP